MPQVGPERTPADPQITADILEQKPRYQKTADDKENINSQEPDDGQFAQKWNGAFYFKGIKNMMGYDSEDSPPSFCQRKDRSIMVQNQIIH